MKVESSSLNIRGDCLKELDVTKSLANIVETSKRVF